MKITLKAFIFIPQNFGKLYTELEFCDVASAFQKFLPPFCNLSFLCIFFTLEFELSVIIVLLCFSCIDPPVSTRSARGAKSERVSSKIPRDSGRGEGGADARTLSPTLMKDISCEDDKGRIMEEVMKTYIKQHEKLNTILRRKQQLQMVQWQSECISPWAAGSWCGLAGSTVNITSFRLHHLETPEHTDHLSLSLNPGTKSSISLMLMSFEPTNKWCFFSLQLLGPSSSCFCCML